MLNLINLREAELVDKPVEGATLCCLNPDGTINRVSAANVGGSGGNTAVINLVDVTSSPVVGTCDTMTFEEACDALETGKPINFIVRYSKDGNYDITIAISATEIDGVIAIGGIDMHTLYWTADGISDTKPINDSGASS